MKGTTLILAGVLMTSVFTSCKKDSETQTTPTNFTQLKVGNYWVYERFNVDASGSATATGILDSCYVEKDTIIDTTHYFKFIRPEVVGSTYSYQFVRDSLHYLVNSDGQILFSSQNFTDTFNSYFITAGPTDTVCEVFVKMADKNLSLNLPAGQFQTYSFKQTFEMYPNWSASGNPRYIDTRYAVNVGIVSETFPFFSSSPNYIQRRLVRYHLN